MQISLPPSTYMENNSLQKAIYNQNHFCPSWSLSKGYPMPTLVAIKPLLLINHCTSVGPLCYYRHQEITLNMLRFFLFFFWLLSLGVL